MLSSAHSILTFYLIPLSTLVFSRIPGARASEADRGSTFLIAPYNYMSYDDLTSQASSKSYSIFALKQVETTPEDDGRGPLRTQPVSGFGHCLIICFSLKPAHFCFRHCLCSLSGRLFFKNPTLPNAVVTFTHNASRG